MNDNYKIVSVDIGGTNVRIGILDGDLRLYDYDKVSSSFLNDNNGKEKLCNFIKKFIQGKNVKAGIIGMPSIVSKNMDEVFQTPNILGFNNIKLGSYLTKEINIKFYIERDVNNLLIYDVYSKGLDKNHDKNIVGIYIGTGLGNAIYINGNIYRGKNGVSGELGHVKMVSNSTICTCGQVGCYETICSGKYLSKVKNAFYESEEFNGLFIKHNKEEILRKFVDNLSYPISNEINILDPDIVVLGGGVIDMEGFPIYILKERIINKLRMPYPKENIEFVDSLDCQKNGVVGGAINYFNYIKN